MSILDKAEIGNLVQVNLELSKDRLTKEIIDACNYLMEKSNGFLKMKLTS